jgi:hypothetical protein
MIFELAMKRIAIRIDLGHHDGTALYAALVKTTPMRCFYHQEKESVGLCKYCAKGLCVECAIDLGKGLACKGKCEEGVRAVIELVDRNIKSLASVPRVQVTSQRPPPPLSPAHSIDTVAAQLSGHIRAARRFWRGAGVCGIGVGAVLVIAALSGGSGFYAIIGISFILGGSAAWNHGRVPTHEAQLTKTATR